MSYGVFNWWWGEDDNSNTLLKKWWQHQQGMYLTNLTITEDYQSEHKDGDYENHDLTQGNRRNKGNTLNKLDGKYLIVSQDDSKEDLPFISSKDYAFCLERRFRLSHSEKGSQPKLIFPKERYRLLFLLGWSREEIVPRMLAQEHYRFLNLTESNQAHLTDPLLFGEEGEKWTDLILNPQSKINLSFFKTTKEYTDFMNANFILIAPLGYSRAADNLFPNLELEQDTIYEDLCQKLGFSFNEVDMTKCFIFPRPALRNIMMQTLWYEFPNEMKWLLDDIIQSTLTTPLSKEERARNGLIRTPFMDFLYGLVTGKLDPSEVWNE
jgi:hypothetical protein